MGEGERMKEGERGRWEMWQVEVGFALFGG